MRSSDVDDLHGRDAGQRGAQVRVSAVVQAADDLQSVRADAARLLVSRQDATAGGVFSVVTKKAINPSFIPASDS